MKHDYLKVQVGDAVLIVYAYGLSRDPIHTKVTHVGRKWITVNDGSRFKRENGAGEHGYGWNLYPSEQAYVDECAAADAWRAFLNEFRYLPTNATKEMVEHAAAVLRGEVEVPTKTKRGKHIQ